MTAEKAILFDMDGVLVVSETYSMESTIEALTHWGIHATREEFAPFVGMDEAGYIGGVSRLHGVPFEPAMRTLTYQLYDQKVRGQNIACPHVRETLEQLRRDGWKLAVCSSAHSSKVRINIRELGLRDDAFDVILTGGMVERLKPFPDVFLTAAGQLGVAPARCVVVEDAVSGIRAAKAAGMFSVGMTTFFTAQQLREQAAPTAIVDDLLQLPDTVRAFVTD